MSLRDPSATIPVAAWALVGWGVATFWLGLWIGERRGGPLRTARLPSHRMLVIRWNPPEHPAGEIVARVEGTNPAELMVANVAREHGLPGLYVGVEFIGMVSQ
jgi:hypothetical protein